MTEMVLITEHGGRYHRDQQNDDGTVCGSCQGGAQRVSRMKARMLGYQPCGTCYQHVKEVNGFTLYQEDGSRWTDESVKWTCYTDKSIVLCPACEELVSAGDVVYFCVVERKPLHRGCRSDCDASPGEGEKHLHRLSVFVDQDARMRRYRQLKEEAPAGPGQDRETAEQVLDAVQDRKVERRVISAVKRGGR